MAGPSGCGLCGLESIDQVMRPLNVLPETRAPSQTALDHAISQFRPAQTLSLQTAGAHAAAWCAWDGDLVAIREDVGRHNALDKLLGWRSRNAAEGFVLVSSRASYEMVSKCVAAGVGRARGDVRAHVYGYSVGKNREPKPTCIYFNRAARTLLMTCSGHRVVVKHLLHLSS
jgi:hypothetical protein